MTELVFFEERPVRGRVLPVLGDMDIGREGCSVVLPDPEVSRRHAVVALDEGVATIEDVGSTNGTWVNGRRIVAPTALATGDVVRLGKTVWHVRAGG